MATTMRAVGHDAYGRPEDVLTLREVDRPAVGDDEVLIRVRSAGVDMGVWHFTAGLPYVGRLGFGLRGPRSRVRGMDVAGVVHAVGARVTRFHPGDEVFGVCNGSFAEYAVARPDKLAPKPANLTFDEAAAVAVSATTALRGVRDAAGVEAGQRVLIVGASGGVGSYAVQLAVAAGAHVTAVCGPAKGDLVRSIGAAEVIDYTREDFTATGRRWDVIVDIAGNRPLSRLRRALAPRGTLVILGGEGGGRWFGGLHRNIGLMLLSPFARQRMRAPIALVTAADLDALTDLIEAGKIRPVVDRTYPLGQAPEAVGYLRAGLARGKVVVTVAA
jgi:NADPH:quinone reductase-like Zn-dependent oxidoreductase